MRLVVVFALIFHDAAETLPLIINLEHSIVPDKCKADFSEFNVVRFHSHSFCAAGIVAYPPLSHLRQQALLTCNRF